MRSLILSSLALAGLCAGASAAVNVTKNSVAISPPGGGAWTTAPTIQAATGDVIAVTADAGESVAVTINNTATSGGVVTLDVYNVGGIASITNSPQYDGRLYVRLATATGDISNITAHAIGTVRSANGNIVGSIIVSDSTASSDDPTVGIGSITATNYSVRASITCSSGKLGAVTASNGTIGTSAATRSSITGGQMGFFKAQSIYADISATGSVVDGLRATVGDFVGSLTASRLATGVSDRRIVVAGNLDADITLNGTDAVPEFDNNAGGASKRYLPAIYAAGDLKASRTIAIAAGQLKGNIVFNGANGGGAWSGTVSVGGTTVSSASGGRYTQTAADLGGGAVGIVPFKLHRQGSIPASGSTVNTKKILWTGLGADPYCGTVKPVIRIAHYGRVTPNTANSDPLYLVYVAGGSSDLSSSYDMNAAESEVGGRTVTVLPTGGAAWPLGEHQFRLRQVSANVSKLSNFPGPDSGSGPTGFVPLPGQSVGTPDDDTYVVTFIALCDQAWKEYYDLNGDGLLTMGDAIQWFATPVDFNNNGVIDAGDVAMQLNAISTIGDE